jgi:hypothetical protein
MSKVAYLGKEERFKDPKKCKGFRLVTPSPSAYNLE